jgi:vacuolar-type H+-ATPase subunit F/Vma7
MRSLHLLLLGTLVVSSSWGQNNEPAIRQWQSQHPTVLLISSDRYEAMSEKERSMLGEYIVFDDRITLGQLESYSAEQEKNNAGVVLLKEADANYVKQWRGQNQDVKIVPQSVFSSLEESRKQIYLDNPRCLILSGEILTIKDIELFEQR